MSYELTDWFSSDIKPFYPGVYIVAYWSKEKYSFARWNGKYWLASISVFFRKDAFKEASKLTSKNDKQNLPWRGLVHKPKGFK